MGVFRTGDLSSRFLRVWQRNFTVYKKNWKIGFIPPILEPIFYIVAFGIGLSMMIKEFSYRGEPISYTAFIAPALVAVNIMNSAFFENTYNSFVRMYYQKTFAAMLTTPLSLPEVISGEILWGATKSVIGTLVMQAVLTCFGLINYPEGLILPFIALLGGLTFGSLGMFFTAKVPSIDVFNLPIFLFITPMFLFSGTFFPLENLPGWAQLLALFLPLTHLVNLTRSCALGFFPVDLLWSLGYLLMLGLIVFPLAVRGMEKRMIL